jgi:outer membrane lipoprotein-sorting protein
MVGRRIVWQYKEIQLNAGLTPTLFRMRVPMGTTRVTLEELPVPEGDTLPSIW